MKLSRKEANDIKANYKIENDNFYDFDRYIITEGVKIYLKKEIAKHFPMYRLEIFVDCLRLFDGVEINVEDADKIEAIVKQLIYANFELYKELVLSRIDYRYDVVVPNTEVREELFKLYKRLANKGNYMKKVISFAKNISAHNVDLSLRYANKSRGTNIYDKEHERKSKYKDIKSYEKSVVRFEAQIGRAHIRYMKKKEKINDKLQSYLNNERYIHYMLKMIVSIVHTGDYYTVKRAETIINKSNYKVKQKEEMKDFLKLVAKKRSLQAAIDSNYYKKYKKILKQLEALNINPVPIPKNDGISHIKNPIKNIVK